MLIIYYGEKEQCVRRDRSISPVKKDSSLQLTDPPKITIFLKKRQRLYGGEFILRGHYEQVTRNPKAAQPRN